MISLITFIHIIFFTKICICEDSQNDDRLYSGYLLKKVLQTVPNLKDKWNTFKQNMGLKFESSASEKDRLFIFGKSAVFVEELKKSNISYEVELNDLAHLSRQEYFNLMGLKGKLDEPDNVSHYQKVAYARAANPPSIDWRHYYVIPPIKSQGYYCGSCYSFAAVATVEARMAYKTKRSKLYSEQNPVDCSRYYGNEGCDGGYHTYVYRYWMDYGLVEGPKYLYTGEEGTCRQSSNKPIVKDFVVLTPGDELSLKQALYDSGPIGIGVDARWDSFRFYKSGIYDEPNCSTYYLTHAMAIVGYYNEPEPYYVVRNSWGRDWGDDGYWNVKADVNMCGITKVAAYPIIE